MGSFPERENDPKQSIVTRITGHFSQAEAHLGLSSCPSHCCTGPCDDPGKRINHRKSHNAQHLSTIKIRQGKS